MRKNTWYAVYHQRELEFLARSYQPGYFFMFMGRKPLTEYLPIDGSKPMTGDLTLPSGGKIIFGTDVMIKSSANLIQIKNVADTAYRNVMANVFYGMYFRAFTVDSQFRTFDAVGGLFDFYSYDGAAWVLCATLGDTDDAFVIPRAGDITFLDGKAPIIDKIDPLPAADAGSHGKIFILSEAGVGDRAYICLVDNNIPPSYAWKLMAQF